MQRLKTWWANFNKPDLKHEEYVGRRHFSRGCEYLVSAYFKLVRAEIVQRNFISVDWHFKDDQKFFQITICIVGREMVEGDL